LPGWGSKGRGEKDATFQKKLTHIGENNLQGVFVTIIRTSCSRGKKTPLFSSKHGYQTGPGGGRLGGGSANYAKGGGLSPTPAREGLKTRPVGGKRITGRCRKTRDFWPDVEDSSRTAVNLVITKGKNSAPHWGEKQTALPKMGAGTAPAQKENLRLITLLELSTVKGKMLGTLYEGAGRDPQEFSFVEEEMGTRWTKALLGGKRRSRSPQVAGSYYQSVTQGGRARPPLSWGDRRVSPKGGGTVAFRKRGAVFKGREVLTHFPGSCGDGEHA